MSFISLPSVYLCYVRSYNLKAFLAPLVAIKNHTVFCYCNRNNNKKDKSDSLEGDGAKGGGEGVSHSSHVLVNNMGKH